MRISDEKSSHVRNRFQHAKSYNCYPVKLTYMLRIYVDTDVFLNLWFQEMLEYNPAFERTERLLEAVISCRFFLIISELTLEELSRRMRIPLDKVRVDYFGRYESLGKLGFVEITQEIVDEARQISRRHEPDATHAVVAKQKMAILITRNIRHFLPMARKLGLKVRLPEQVI